MQAQLCQAVPQHRQLHTTVVRHPMLASILFHGFLPGHTHTLQIWLTMSRWISSQHDCLKVAKCTAAESIKAGDYHTMGPMTFVHGLHGAITVQLRRLCALHGSLQLIRMPRRNAHGRKCPSNDDGTPTWIVAVGCTSLDRCTHQLTLAVSIGVGGHKSVVSYICDDICIECTSGVVGLHVVSCIAGCIPNVHCVPHIGSRCLTTSSS